MKKTITIPNPDAYQFFKRMEAFLNDRIPTENIVREEIEKVVSESKQSVGQRQKAFPEGAFLNHYLYHNLHDYLLTLPGFDKEKARQSLLSESHKSLSDIASGSAAHRIEHPFRKVIGVTPEEVMKGWQGNGAQNPVARSYPDFALQSPCPYKTVFEGKYFPKGSKKAAEKSLATDLYQAFFYLGLSKIPETNGKAAWDYDYACLLAFDATEQGHLVNAWESLDPEVKQAFWGGANIYVMILRGS
jgi:hypothetical protein